MLEHARQFISFVLPPIADGQFYNLHWRQKNQDGKAFWDGRACTSVEDFIKTLNWALKSGGKDLYVCMSSQSHCTIKTSKRGYEYKQALRSQDNVVALRSLFVDIDVKPDAYPETKDALIALKSFVTSTGMPNPSAIVGSGSGGIHAHWVLPEALAKDDWQTLANALARAAQKFGLKFDSQCTIDSARILRIPETFNHKHDPAAPVKLMWIDKNQSPASLDEIRAALGSHIEALPKKTPIKDNDDLGAGVVGKAAPVKLEHVADRCAFIARSIETGGKDNSQPLWFMTTVIASHTEGGRKDAHTMASGHPGYTPESTDQMYDRVLDTKKNRDLGWPQCLKIAGSGAKECETCPLFAQNKSPLNFALRAANDVSDDTLPATFFRNAEGYIFHRMVDDTGASIAVQISNYPMWDAWLSTNPWTLHFTTRTDRVRKSGFELPTEVIAGEARALSKYLGAKGFFVSDKIAKVLKDFFMAWIQKLQMSKDAVISSAPFGWSVVDDHVDGFTYAGRVWNGTEDRPAISPEPMLALKYSPKGKIEPWMEMSKIIASQKSPGLDAILASSFAAPLVHFTGQNGVMVNAYSIGSGIGKTTAMITAQAVWGDPRSMQGLDDTLNQVTKKLASLNTLPLYWDEIKTKAQTERFAELAFKLTKGSDKGRLKSDASFAMQGTWNTMLASASNDSILDALQRANKSTDAGLYRAFEFTIEKSPHLDPSKGGHVQRVTSQLNNNYGHVGLIYAKFLGANSLRIKNEVAEMYDKLQTELSAQSEERFWIAVITSLLSGAKYANECGVTKIDLKALKAFLVTVLSKMRDAVKESPNDINDDMSVSTILAHFINVMRQRHMLITNRITISKGKPAKDSIMILNDLSKLDWIAIQVGRDDKLMRISCTAFNTWLSEHGYSIIPLTKKLKDEYGMEKKNAKLGGGTSMVTAMEYVWELDTNHPKLKGVIE